MKKIVGILAAAAVLATSVFAADITAKVRLDGSLFNYGTDGSISALKIMHNAGEAHNPILSWSYGDDKSGANGKMWTVKVGDDNFAPTTGEYKIWFSPAENFKLTFGHQDFNLNQEQIAWYRSDSGSAGGQGYGLSYAANGLSFDLLLAGGWNTPWMSKAENADLGLKATNVKVAYSADFGTIAAILVAENTFKKIKFGAGYNNNFDGIFVFVNALGYVEDGFNKFRLEAFAKGNADALGWAVWVPFDFNVKGSKAAVGANVKLTYALESCSAYLDINDGNFLADNFAITVKPGLTGSVGKASWDVAVNFNIANKVGIDVPVGLAVEW